MNFFKSTLIVSICTLLSRVFGFIRDVFFAKYLGTGYLADVFLTAFKLPNFFRNIFTEGAFNSAFIPIFSSELVKNENKNTVINFSRNIFSILLYFILIITILAEIFMPQLVSFIAPGFSNIEEKFNLVVSLSKITILYLLFISLVSFMSAILNSYGKFAVVSITPVILNITLITFSILSTFINKNVAMILSYGVVVGGILQFLWLLFFTLKNKMILYPVYPKFDEITKRFFKNFFNGFLGYGIIQINSMIDAIMATQIAGAVSFIYYADRISQLPLALIGTAISITILPVLSKKITLQEENRFDIQEKAIFTAIFLGIPCAIGLFLLSDLFIPILFERGKFTSQDSFAVISCLKLYAFSLPVFMLIKILQTIFYANKDTKTPMYSSLVNLVLNITLNIIFVKYFGYRGIVLSTVISAYVNAIILSSVLLMKKLVVLSGVFYLQVIKLIYPVLFMVLSIVCCKKYLIIPSENILVELFNLALISGISGGLYLFLSFVLRVVDLGVLLGRKGD